MNLTKTILILTVINLLILAGGIYAFKKLNPKVPHEDVIRNSDYNLIITKLYYLDSLINNGSKRLDNIYIKTENLQKEISKHNVNKINKNSIVIPDTSSLLRELSEFTK